MSRREELEHLIIAQEALVEQHLRATAHKDQCGDGPSRELYRLSEELRFVVAGAVPEKVSPGVYKVLGFHVSFRSRKYRKPGKGTWYRYRDPSEFVQKYGACQA